MEGDTIVMSEIFKFDQTGITSDGRVIGELKPTGIRPLFSPRLEAAGFKLGPDVFGVNLDGMFGSRSRR
jgi:pilus assembly protein CpaF